jgi:uncharacterized membrane protein YuzA (DUF378 family)
MDLFKVALFFLVLAGLHTGAMGLTGVDLFGSVFGGSRSLGKRTLFVIFGLSALYIALTAFQTTEGFKNAKRPPSGGSSNARAAAAAARAQADRRRGVPILDCSKVSGGAKYNKDHKTCVCNDKKSYFNKKEMKCLFCPKGSISNVVTCECQRPMFNAKTGKCVLP